MNSLSVFCVSAATMLFAAQIFWFAAIGWLVGRLPPQIDLPILGLLLAVFTLRLLRQPD